MFTIDMSKNDKNIIIVTLNYNDGINSFQFIPECTDFNVEIGDSGKIVRYGINGMSSLSWNDEIISIMIKNHGEGNGGSLQVNIINNNKIMDSLRDCFVQWKHATTFNNYY